MNFRFHLKALTLEVGVNKGQKGYISKTDGSFSLTMIIGFSFKRIYGWMAISKTNTADSIKWFYSKIYATKAETFSGEDNILILVGDNAITHKSIEVQKFIEGSWIRVITINPLSPWLNPCEYLIAYIKNKVKLQLAKGRYLCIFIYNRVPSLQLLKNIINGCIQNHSEDL